MKKELVEKIKANLDYKKLVRKRSSFSIKMSIAMLTVCFAFILTIAFNPSLLGTPLSPGSVSTIGIIVFAFVLTGFYTLRANSEFDDLSHKIKQSIKEK